MSSEDNHIIINSVSGVSVIASRIVLYVLDNPLTGYYLCATVPS